VRHIWNWITKNSDALQGAAAVIVTLSALVALPIWLGRFAGSDARVVVDSDPGTMPQDLSDWSDDAARVLDPDGFDLSKTGLKAWRLDQMRSLMSSPTAQGLRDPRVNPRRIGRLSLQVQNQSPTTISGVRIRLDEISNVWDVSINGTFIEDKVAREFRDRIGPVHGLQSLVLPELPPIPPESILNVLVYGDMEFARPSISVQGATLTTENVVKMRDSWALRLYRDPFPIYILLVFSLFILYPVIAGTWPHVRRRIIKRAGPGIIYDLACAEAKLDNGDQALWLLQKAFQLGYTDTAHAEKDEDLTSIRGRQEFKDLTKRQGREDMRAGRKQPLDG